MLWSIFNLIGRVVSLIKETLNYYNIINIKYVDTDIVDFNIGGVAFATYKSNITKSIYIPNSKGLYEPSLLHKMLTDRVNAKYDKNNAIFIDRNPQYFSFILDYLRKVNTVHADQFKLPKTAESRAELLDEAVFYELHSLADLIRLFSGSKILNAKNTNDLAKLGDLSLADNFRLIYRGSLHGFGAKDFHAKCDNVDKTLTLIKTTQSFIFGGYTSVAWDSSNQFKQDQDAYVFSLVNKDDKPIRLNFDAYNGNYSIYCGSSYGPVFGAGKDFQIADNSQENMKSLSNLGYSYGYKNAHFPYKYKSSEAQAFLAGSYNFQISEIEVYQKL